LPTPRPERIMTDSLSPRSEALLPASPRFPALDGVRALAILGVLAAHTGLAWLPGGFIGVDLFFVLSGFLITSLLLAERSAVGFCDLTGFWAKRVRRLLPAALVMVSAVIAVRSLIAPDAVADLRADGVRACLWVSNWHWALQGTDYFGQGGTASPLQHTWSLAVEEQFYLLWPCLLLLVWRHARSMRVLRARLVAAAGLGVLASALGTAVLGAHATQGRLYFGTDTRAQELCLGALLAAVLAPTWSWAAQQREAKRSPQGLGVKPLPSLLALIGLIGLTLVATRADGSQQELHDGLMLLVSCLAAALIAGCVLDRRIAVAPLLGAPPMRLLGRISYGVYLWHWPLFEVLDGPRTGLGAYPLAALRVTAALACGWLSTVVIEAPTRRLRLPSWRVLQFSAVAVAGALTFAACTGPSTSAGPSTPVGTTVTAASSKGLDSPPGVTASATTTQPGAHAATSTRRRHGTSTVVDVFGDSIGWTLATYLPPTPGFQFLNRTVLGCGIERGGSYRYFGQVYAQHKQCDAWPTDWLTRVRADRPDDVVLVVGRWETMDRVYRGSWTHVGQAPFDSYLQGLLTRAVDVLGSTGAHVIVTTEPYNRRGEQPDGQLYAEDQPARVDAWNAIVRRVASARPRMKLLDLNRKLCPAGTFTWTVDGIQVRSDGVHLTPHGVRWLTPWLLRALPRA
jgi:peptidoglycan/LPS O-acetylase OafA/YrhL